MECLDYVDKQKIKKIQKKFRRWFGPYVVVTTYENATYLLRELDGTLLKIAIVGKRIKVFRERDERFVMENFEDIPLQENYHEMESREMESEEDYEDTED